MPERADKLSTTTSAPAQILMGCVRYGDYESPDFNSDPANLYSPFMLKKIEYEDEREVRIICNMFRCEAKGVPIPVDVDLLVEQTIFSPCVNPAVVDGVSKAIRGMEYGFPISQSSILKAAKVY